MTFSGSSSCSENKDVDLSWRIKPVTSEWFLLKRFVFFSPARGLSPILLLFFSGDSVRHLLSGRGNKEEEFLLADIRKTWVLRGRLGCSILDYFSCCSSFWMITFYFQMSLSQQNGYFVSLFLDLGKPPNRRFKQIQTKCLCLWALRLPRAALAPRGAILQVLLPSGREKKSHLQRGVKIYRCSSKAGQSPQSVIVKAQTVNKCWKMRGTSNVSLQPALLLASQVFYLPMHHPRQAHDGRFLPVSGRHCIIPRTAQGLTPCTFDDCWLWDLSNSSS